MYNDLYLSSLYQNGCLTLYPLPLISPDFSPFSFPQYPGKPLIFYCLLSFLFFWNVIYLELYKVFHINFFFLARCFFKFHPCFHGLIAHLFLLLIIFFYMDIPPFSLVCLLIDHINFDCLFAFISISST